MPPFEFWNVGNTKMAADARVEAKNREGKKGGILDALREAERRFQMRRTSA